MALIGVPCPIKTAGILSVFGIIDHSPIVDRSGLNTAPPARPADARPSAPSIFLLEKMRRFIKTPNRIVARFVLTERREADGTACKAFGDPEYRPGRTGCPSRVDRPRGVWRTGRTREPGSGTKRGN